jgi:hypothetical protein
MKEGVGGIQLRVNLVVCNPAYSTPLTLPPVFLPPWRRT